MSEKKPIFVIDGYEYSPEHVGDVGKFPVLMGLAEERVLEVSVVRGAITVQEACDHYFSVDLTPDELDALADEFKALAQIARG